MTTDYERLTREFLQNRNAMARARFIVRREYGINMQEFEMLLFDALADAVRFKPDERGFVLYVHKTLCHRCVDWVRQSNKHNDGRMEFENTDIYHTFEPSRVLHSEQLINAIIDKIDNVENEDDQNIIFAVLICGDNYEKVTDNVPAAWKTVERFRKELQKEFKEYLNW